VQDSQSAVPPPPKQGSLEGYQERQAKGHVECLQVIKELAETGDCTLPWLKEDKLEDCLQTITDHLKKTSCHRKLPVWRKLTAWMQERALKWPLSSSRISEFIRHTSSAPTMGNSLKNTLTWYRKYLGAPIDLQDVVLPVPAIQAVQTSSFRQADMFAPEMILHLEAIILDTARTRELRYLATVSWVATMASLRVEDCQKSAILSRDSSGVVGCAWAGKTPKGLPRGKPMRWIVPNEGIVGKCVTDLLTPSKTDYLFPDVNILELNSPELKLLDSKASNPRAVVIIRHILQLPPLNLSADEANEFQGHSFKSTLNSFSQMIGLKNRNYGHWRSPNVMEQRYDRLQDISDWSNIFDMILRLRNAFTDPSGNISSKKFDWNKMKLDVTVPAFREPEHVLSTSSASEFSM
jgi:hypothetical protein